LLHGPGDGDEPGQLRPLRKARCGVQALLALQASLLLGLSARTRIGSATRSDLVSACTRRRCSARVLLSIEQGVRKLNELDDPAFELDALKSLILALFKTKSIDEVEPLVRYREAATRRSRKGAGCSSARIRATFSSLLTFTRSGASAPRIWQPPLHCSALAASTAE
jgi:hypothetical protein